MLEKRIIPHEVLIRYGREGSLQGAHIITATQVVEDGAIISDVIGDAQPLALASDAFSAVINEGLRQACQRGDELEARAKELEGKLAEATAQLGALGAQLKTKDQMIADLILERDALAGKIAAMETLAQPQDAQ